MRIFVAGGSGVIGRRLVPLLVDAGHDVVAMTRTPAKQALLAGFGAEPVVIDVYDAPGVLAALAAARPDAVIHQLTDLPDDVTALGAATRDANARVREVGTDNLLAAAAELGIGHLLVQSIAWLVDGVRAPSVVHLERATRAARGVVLRYGQWYGAADTYHPDTPPPGPRVDIDVAAQLTIDALDLMPGTYELTDDGIAPVDDA